MNKNQQGSAPYQHTPPHRLFVYGTLRRGYNNSFAQDLQAEATHLGVGTIQARIYAVAHFPGVVASPDPVDRVLGDLYDLPRDSALWGELDRYEGYDASRPDSSLYIPRVVQVIIPDLEQTPPARGYDAWVYFYNRIVRAEALIPNGDWLQWAREQRR